MRPRIPSSRSVMLGVALAFATLFVYWPALSGGLLIDDTVNITKPELRSVTGLVRIWTEPGATQQYYPALYTAFWVEHRLWGDATIGYHLTNILLHLLSAGLLVAIVRRLALPGAWLAAFIFALHPVCVESVAWIAEQKNTLSTALFLGAALVYLNFDSTRKRAAYIAALVLFALALLTKTVTATLPAALLVIFWWRRGRVAFSRDVFPLLPWFVIGAAAGIFSAWVEHRYVGAQGADFALSFIERMLIAARGFWFYLGKLAWPQQLVFMYPRWTVDSGVWWQWMFPLGALGLAAALTAIVRKHRGPLAVLLLFAGLLFPTMGFLNIYWFKISFVADHFAYLPALALIVPAAATFTQVFTAIPRPAWLGPVLCALPLTILGAHSWQRSQIYRDHKTLCERTLAQNPEAWMMHNNLGFILGDEPARLSEALGHFQTAVRLKPDFADAHFNLGRAWERMPSRLPDAITAYETATRLAPRDFEAHFRLGCALGNAGRAKEAAGCFRAAVGLKPDHAEANFNLAMAIGETTRNTGEAIACLEAAVRANPAYLDAQFMLGNTLAANGRLAEAVAPFRAALHIDPELVEAHFNLGCVLFDLQRPAEALVEFETVLKLRPDLEAARQMREKALAARR